MLTDEQRSFLKELQQELNTQDTVGQADPRFWVVRDWDWKQCPEEDADHYEMYDCDGDQVGSLFSDVSEDLIAQMNEVQDITVTPVNKHEYNAENTMFLTLRECKEHIYKNAHHYHDPRAFAMTAWRSPQVEKLIKILQTVDWDDVK